MRTIFFALAAATCLATPALAQEREVRVAETLGDPAVQDGLAAAVSAIAGIVLDTRVGSLAPYSDGRVRPGDTLRDVKRREDPGFERRLRQDTRRAVGLAGQVAGDAASASGAIIETADRLRAALAPLADAVDARRDEYGPD
ncbi:hypothetical protein [Sphingomonas turrisvirgatae]|uniref:DUF4197 domain-containing protein n=1 Tax=Sphingomonas turrisvirgatae TaxID=1888892 RepID=A0A1E3LTU7_9SPHN|nr:hypothetical protein [Sphingomonas turrisvirgatae]ODP37201.1 hypothetical protein BFL28_02935 [Sphingomonas turrisvirgatae]